MAKEKKSKALFLTQGNLFPWERPLKPGYIKIPMGMKYNAQTELVKSLGMEIFNRDVGRYSVQATAAKYLARVILLDKNVGLNGMIDLDDEIFGTPQRRIVFRGAITIYNKGQIPGTELGGFDLESTGRIWLARPYTLIYRSDQGLSRIILGQAVTEEGKERRIKAIIRSHEEIKKERANAIIEREHAAHQSGKSQTEEKAFGTFGRRF